MAVLDTSWADIVLTDEYTADLAMLTDMAINSLGIEEFVDSTNPFVFALANLCAIQRYFARHLPEVVDLDLTPFLPELAAEIGLVLPFSPEFPYIEWLRENKHWLGARGSQVLYPFISALMNSPINLHFPGLWLCRASDINSCASGAYNPTAANPRPMETSKRNHIKDGWFWAPYTYVVQVTQAQNLTSISDLVVLLTNIHPAGTKMFLELDYSYYMAANRASMWGSNVINLDAYFMAPSWPTVDNGWTVSTRSPQVSMHGMGW